MGKITDIVHSPWPINKTGEIVGWAKASYFVLRGASPGTPPLRNIFAQYRVICPTADWFGTDDAPDPRARIVSAKPVLAPAVPPRRPGLEASRGKTPLP